VSTFIFFSYFFAPGALDGTIQETPAVHADEKEMNRAAWQEHFFLLSGDLA
jgi:hypothetical protein